MSAAARNAGTRYHVSPRTLVFILDGDYVLLMKRSATRRVLPGRYNGLGGHVEHHETVEECARREVLEESGIAALTDLRLRAVINAPECSEAGVLLFVFTAATLDPILHSTSEGGLVWVHRDQLRSLPLVDDLHDLLPAILDRPDFFYGHYDMLPDGGVRVRLVPT